MSIAGVGTTLIRLLRDEYKANHGGLNELSFELFTTTDFEGSPSKKVSLFLYRVEIDPTRRHKEIPAPSFDKPSRTALALHLRFLLTVWVNDAEFEHQVLQDCMEILEKNAIVSGVQLDPAYKWDPGEALKVSIDSISHEDMMRLWDMLDPKFRLSIPYLVRTATLTPMDQPVAPPVTSRVHVIRQGVDS